MEKADDGTSYKFTTTSGLVYVAYFTEFILLDVNGEEIQVVSFGFACDRPDETKRHDSRVKLTIIHIVEEFFATQSDEALLYMCMDGDGKGRNRYITFGRWFREAGGLLEKYNFASRDPKARFYSSIILSSGNPQKQRMIDAFYYTISYWGL
ncbi:DUF6169 family protein [Arcticibacter tournemirensis]